MLDQWNLLKDVNWIAPDRLEARVRVPQDCIWFTGHFPGEPILPGIALVYTVYEAILRTAQKRGEAVSISSLKRVRFTGPVRPGEAFLLNLTGEDRNTEILFNFKVIVHDKVICSGQAAATKRPSGIN
ncbi:MAG: hypothetical protein K4571_00630 [Deltaproteobacteria bacterium]